MAAETLLQFCYIFFILNNNSEKGVRQCWSLTALCREVAWYVHQGAAEIYITDLIPLAATERTVVY